MIRKTVALTLIVLLTFTLSACSFSLNGNVNNIPSYGEGTSEVNEEQAREIVIDMVTGSEDKDIIAFKEDVKEGSLVYSGRLAYDDKNFDFEIDEATGNIISWKVSGE